jgi:hypothetical protein
LCGITIWKPLKESFPNQWEIGLEFPYEILKEPLAKSNKTWSGKLWVHFHMEKDFLSKTIGNSI